MIPGLYAAGELVGGLFYFNYPGGTGLMTGAVFGKIAGTTAASAPSSNPEPHTWCYCRPAARSAACEKDGVNRPLAAR